jgi:hydroxyethylthiazole kinase-like uncharacterized protein yjeF
MPLPVLTVEQMRAWETATWAAGVREADVIARVGECVAGKVRELVKPGSRVLLLAGKGNNGNDVRAAGPHLAGLIVDRLDVSSPAAALPELEKFLALNPALVVDGLFGIGVNRPLSGEWCRLIEVLNDSHRPVLAVDVPSGLDADSGAHFGAAVRAAVTLTVGAPKRGLVQGEAAEFVGRLEVTDEVGLLPDPAKVVGEQQGRRSEDGWKFLEAWTLAEDYADLPPRRAVTDHKGSFGHLLIVAGSLGYHGAAVLAAKAAGAARPGLVTVVTSPEAYPAIAGQLAFAMVRPWSQPLKLPAKATAVLVGPGLAGTDVPDWLRAQTVTWWRELPLPLIVDASALDWLAAIHREWWARVAKSTPSAEELMQGHDTWLHHPAVRVITPHPGEAARWFPEGNDGATQDRFGVAARLAAAAGIAALKGHQTLVRSADAPTFINPTGNPGLAQGGSGDTLAGFLAGLLAQPALQSDALRTVRYAVWEHGRAADRLEAQRRNWTAEDLAIEVGR